MKKSIVFNVLACAAIIALGAGTFWIPALVVPLIIGVTAYDFYTDNIPQWTPLHRLVFHATTFVCSSILVIPLLVGMNAFSLSTTTNPTFDNYLQAFSVLYIVSAALIMLKAITNPLLARHFDPWLDDLMMGQMLKQIHDPE